MNLCTDCANVKLIRGVHGQDTYTCIADENIIDRSRVTGLPRYNEVLCVEQRSFYDWHAYLTGHCGRSGRWFKLKVEENVE